MVLQRTTAIIIHELKPFLDHTLYAKQGHRECKNACWGPDRHQSCAGASAQCCEGFGQHRQGHSCVGQSVVEGSNAHQHDFWELWWWQALAMFLAPLPIHSIAQQLVDVGLRAAGSDRGFRLP